LKTKIIIDGFSNIDLSQYPDFLDQARQVGLGSLLDAINICNEAARTWGNQFHLLIRITPNGFPNARKLLLACFTIHIACSQHKEFRMPNGTILKYWPKYKHFERGFDASDHLEWAEVFYKTLDKVKK